MRKTPNRRAIVARLELIEQRLSDLQAGLDSISSLIDSFPRAESIAAQLLPLCTALDQLELARANDASRYELVSQRMELLTKGVAEGIAHVDRSENRIKATVGRAQRQLADAGVESAGVEAEATDLRLLDGGASGDERLPAVQSEVDQPVAPPPGIPGGFTSDQAATLRRVLP